MRRLTTGLVLAAAAGLLCLACGEDNPFNANPDNDWEGGQSLPHIQMTGTGSGGMGSSVLTDTDPSTEGVQDAILVVFDQSMDPATMAESSLELAATTAGGAAPTVDDVSYYPSARRMEIQATFSRETAYLLTLKAGSPTDLAGNPLDPNHNAQADGSPWDDALRTFHTGAAEERDLTSPWVAQHIPGETGGVTDPATPILIAFQEGPMAPASFTGDALRLLVTEDSSEVSLEIDTVTAGQVLAIPDDSLSPGTRYTVVLSASVTDTTGNLLDTNADGYIWPDEQDYVWDFQMADDSTTNATPPTVAKVSSELPRTFDVEFEESLTGDDVSIDASTLVPANLQCIDNLGQVPIEVGDPGPGGDVVSCYMLREPAGEVTVVVTIGVKDTDGNPLDGNGNGLGGEPGVDDWTGTL
jgi:hypothetical protein